MNCVSREVFPASKKKPDKIMYTVVQLFVKKKYRQCLCFWHSLT